MPHKIVNTDNNTIIMLLEILTMNQILKYKLVSELTLKCFETVYGLRSDSQPIIK